MNKEHPLDSSKTRPRSTSRQRLQRFRWWHLLGRARFYLDDTYAVDVRHWQNQSSGEVTAQLYYRGALQDEAKLPASFPVEGGVIEVAMSPYGMKRCHFVSDEAKKGQRPLTPDPASAEGRRARLERRHPLASRAIGAFSILLLLIGLVLLVQQVAVPLLQIPPIAARVGPVEAPISLPVWLNIAVAAITAAAASERALRLRYNWLLDGGGA